jgi:hypothetical protein
LEFHQPVLESQIHVVGGIEKMVPASKNGSKKQLQTVFKGLNIPVEGVSSSTDWASTTSSEEKVTVGHCKS